MVKFLDDFSWKVEGRRTAIQLKVRFIASIFAQWIWSHKTWLVESPQSQELFCFFSRNSILWCNMCFRQSAFWQTLIAWVGWFITWSHKNIPESLEQKYRAAVLAVSGPSNVSSSSGLCGSRREGGILRWKERTELWIPDGTEQLPRKNHWFEQGGRYLTNPNNALFFSGNPATKTCAIVWFFPQSWVPFCQPPVDTVSFVEWNVEDVASCKNVSTMKCYLLYIHPIHNLIFQLSLASGNIFKDLIKWSTYVAAFEWIMISEDAEHTDDESWAGATFNSSVFHYDGNRHCMILASLNQHHLTLLAFYFSTNHYIGRTIPKDWVCVCEVTWGEPN